MSELGNDALMKTFGAKKRYSPDNYSGRPLVTKVAFATVVIVTSLSTSVVAQAFTSQERATAVPGIASHRWSLQQVSTISCPTSGNCSAGGTYSYGSGIPRSNYFKGAFVVNELHGIWQNAIELRGIGAYAVIDSVSCSSAGNCGAVGTDVRGVFVLNEVGGVWGSEKRIEKLSPSADTQWKQFIACPTTANCSVAGNDPTISGSPEGTFVANEINGKWSSAILLPGLPVRTHLNFDQSQLTSISCASPGDCSVGGNYTVGPLGIQTPFVDGEVNGKWGRAIEVPGTQVSDSNVVASVNSVACTSIGNCVAGGITTSHVDSNNGVAFVVNEVHGRWGAAAIVPNTPTPKGNGVNGNYPPSMGQVDVISCQSFGNCSAGGIYSAEQSASKSSGGVFMVSETNGSWQHAVLFPAISTYDSPVLTALSCSSVGNCIGGAIFSIDKSGIYFRARLIHEKNGKWDAPTAIAGTDNPLGTSWDRSEVLAVSCDRSGFCGEGGDFRNDVPAADPLYQGAPTIGFVANVD